MIRSDASASSASSIAPSTGALRAHGSHDDAEEVRKPQELVRQRQCAVVAIPGCLERGQPVRVAERQGRPGDGTRNQKHAKRCGSPGAELAPVQHSRKQQDDDGEGDGRELVR